MRCWVFVLFVCFLSVNFIFTKKGVDSECLAKGSIEKMRVAVEDSVGSILHSMPEGTTKKYRERLSLFTSTDKEVKILYSRLESQKSNQTKKKLEKEKEKGPSLCIGMYSEHNVTQGAAELRQIRATFASVQRHLNLEEPLLQSELIWISAFEEDSSNEESSSDEDAKEATLQLKQNITQLASDLGITIHEFFEKFDSAGGFNKMANKLCTAPYFLRLSPHWRYNSLDIFATLYPSSPCSPMRVFSAAMSFLEQSPRLVGIVLHSIPFSAPTFKEVLAQGKIKTSFRKRCLTLLKPEDYLTSGVYTLGPMIFERSRLLTVGPQYNSLNSPYFPDKFSEANFAIRIGMKFCAGEIQFFPSTHLLFPRAFSSAFYPLHHRFDGMIQGEIQENDPEQLKWLYHGVHPKQFHKKMKKEHFTEKLTRKIVK